MPQTRKERLEDRAEIATELYGIINGILGQLIQYDDDIQMYVSLAGDDTAEMRRTVALLAADMEARIDARIARAKFNIERCHTKALQAVIIEERDKWHSKVKTFSRNIAGLEIRRTAVQRILVVEVPWPDIVRVALGGYERRTGNVAIMDAATANAISTAVSQVQSGMASGTAIPPPPSSPPGTETTELLPTPSVEPSTEIVEEDKSKPVEESKDDSKK